jgi:NAD/NADP transhydrogenase alpha subunit
MRVAVLKERRSGETRVAATPETVKKYIGMGLDVAVEAGAGLASGFVDSAYAEAGATIAADAAAALEGAGIVLVVRAPEAPLPRGALLIGTLGADAAAAAAFAEAGVDACSMELLPRITRAQSMDVLSSQANLAGYRAVIEGAGAYDRGFPMMMTAAGTVPAANAFIMGAGVAGLQAIATARRLGGRVFRDRRAPGGEGGDQVPRRILRRLRGRGEQGRADRGWLCEAALAGILRQAGGSGGGAYRQAGRGGVHRAGARGGRRRRWSPPRWWNR